MTKIVVNRRHGAGFGLSYEACVELDCDPDTYCDDNKRNDPRLVECVEKLGEAASASLSKLEVVEIPDDVEWTIEECDGSEWVAEKHRTW
jgi:hypothetical protein